MAKKKFDKVACQFCGQEIDKRGIKRHEENCSENPANKEDVEVNEEEIDTEEEEQEEEVNEEEEEQEEEVEVTTEEVSTNSEPLVEVLPNQNAKLYYGCKWYYLVEGHKSKVPKGFKEVLVKANMLKPL